MSYGQETRQGENKDKGQILDDNIDVLASPKIGGDNNQLREALGYNLRAIIDAHKKGYIGKDIFKQTIVSGAELSALLDRMGQQKLENLSKEQQDKIYLEYFNVQKKFSGLNINSLANSIKEHKYQELAEKLDPNIQGASKEYLIESLKLGDYLISKEQQDNWNKFCTSICSDQENAKSLGSLVSKLVSYTAHEQWINYIFTESNDPKQPKQTLGKLLRDFGKVDLERIKTASDIINSMDSQIPEWFNPAKFEKMYKELQTNLGAINDNLKWNKDATNLEKILVTQQIDHLVDIMDKSAKSLQRSNFYIDEMKDNKGNDLQVSRFRDMITQFHDQVMVPWVKHAKFEGIGEAAIKLRLGNLINFLNQTNFRLLTTKELFPSSNFSVNTATIDIPGAKHSAPETLEDIFTLVHQNCLVSLNKVTKNLNKIIEKQYPDLIKKLEKEFNNGGLSGERQVVIPSTSLKLSNKELIINKNIPLRDHSAIIRIKYYNNDISLEFQMFGANEGNRWNYVMLDNYFGLMHAGYEFIKKPYFDQDKLVTSFEVRVDNARQITPIISAINHSIQQSYQYSYNNYNIDKARDQCIKRLKLLEELYQKFPEKGLELGNIHFIPSSYINLAMLKNIPNKTEFINNNYTGLLSCPIMDTTVSSTIFGLNDSVKANYFIKNSRGVVNLINSGFYIETILKLYDDNKDKLYYYIGNSSGIVDLVKSGINIETINKLYEDKTTNSKIKYLIKNGWQIHFLVKSGLNIESISTLYDKNLNKLKYFIKEAQKIGDLAESGFNINDLSKLYDNSNNNLKVKYFVEKSYAIEDLVGSGLEPEKLLKLYDNDLNRLEYFISNGCQINHLITYGVKNLFELYDNKQTNAKAKYFIDKKWGFVELIESGLNVETINTLYDKNLDKLKYLIDKSSNVKSLIELKLFAKDEILELYDKDLGKAKLFIENNRRIETLDELGLNPDVLKTLYDKNSKSAESIISYTYDIQELVKNHFPLESIIAICINKADSLKVITKNKEKVYSILEQKQFSPEDLSKCNPDQIQNLLDGRIKPADLKKELFVKQQSTTKEIHGPNSERIIRSRAIVLFLL